MTLLAVALNGGTPILRNAITVQIRDKGWGYWHWIDDFWIVQVSDWAGMTPRLLHDFIVEMVPDVAPETMLVFEVQEPMKFWGRADTAAWEWLGKVGNPS